MLSNPPPSGLPARHHRQHRRQNSTPTAMEATKIANNLPPYPHQQHASQPQPQPQPQQARAGRPRVAHRRGMSLDTRRQHMHSPIVRQDFHTVSEQQTTNTAGYNSAPQHVLREAQQQRIARPGAHQQAFANLANDENYIMSPHGTPHTQAFDPSACFDGLPGPAQTLNMSYNLYNEQMSAMVKKNQENFGGSMAGSQDFELYPSSTMSTPTFMHFNESPSSNAGWISEEETSSSRRSSRRVSNTIMDRVAKFENMGLEDPPRPITPPHQNATDYFPITPMDSPHGGRTTIKSSRGPQRFMEGYDESMEETLKPTRGLRRLKTTFDDMRQAAEAQSPAPVPGPSRSNTMPVPGSFEAPPVATNFLEMSQMNGGMALPTFDGMPEPPYPLSTASSFSHHSTPITPLMQEFRQSSEQKPFLLPPEAAIDSVPCEGSEAGERPPRGHSHRRTESVASVASAASIADIDIEQTKTTTGITMDDIHQYIDGPDPQDNKWVCTFEDCLKRFGRKENIKSHVQTHLNDRQYRCPTCQKCFVRQHDLKRHAKIHTGIKPYPCECGNSFARHDALTRHKQRGMCIGAFDGVVRKVVKRGRPRKHRPEMDERTDKSTRTRKKNMSISSVSSQSGYSDYSAPNSPGEDDDTENDNDNDPEFELLGGIMQDVSMGGTTMNPSSLQGLGASTAPMPTLSPNAALGERSPSVTSIHSYVSQLSHMSLRPGVAAEVLPSNPGSPAKSVSSQYNEPPELSQSSSPPPSCNRFFELEQTVGGPDIMISAAIDPTSLPPMANTGTGEDDMMLQFTHNDPNMLMLSSDSKFDEAFDSSVDMFTHSDDLFFGQN